MCGFAGLINGIDPLEQINKMNSCILHRGPDGSGIWSDESKRVWLAHRRLSIIDLSERGGQPMVSPSGRFVIAFNGEIYNHKTLGAELIAGGYTEGFKSTSDTEVLLHCFEAYGVEETLRRIKGMYAIALYDNKDKTLCLIRDRMGEKPLYYSFINQPGGRRAFAFGSELSCLTGLKGFERDIDSSVLNIYMAQGYIPAPYTIYKGVYKLEAGSLLRIRAPFEDISLERYWDMEEVALKGLKNPFKGSFEEAAQEMEVLIEESLKGQMISDVPLGAFLSAGVDSSTIVSLMQKLSSRPVKTFTIGMEDKDFNEAELSRQIAGILGTEHTELYIDEKDILDIIPSMAGIYSEPFADSSQLPTSLICRLIRKYVTVALSGDAGDELFYGYNVYSVGQRVWSKLSRIPGFLRGPLGSLGMGLCPDSLDFRMRQVQFMRLRAKSPARLYDYINDCEPLVGRIVLDKNKPSYVYNSFKGNGITGMENTMMLMDQLMYLPEDILTKVDRSAMAVSLETRIPLLDQDVVSFVWRLPLEYKYRNGQTKAVLKNILYKYLPRELMERPKKGFSIPIDKWIKEGPLRDWAGELMEPSAIKAMGMLDEKVTTLLWEDFIKRGFWRENLWHILMFCQWYRDVYREG